MTRTNELEGTGLSYMGSSPSSMVLMSLIIYAKINNVTLPLLVRVSNAVSCCTMLTNRT